LEQPIGDARHHTASPKPCDDGFLGDWRQGAPRFIEGRIKVARPRSDRLGPGDLMRKHVSQRSEFPDFKLAVAHCFDLGVVAGGDENLDLAAELVADQLSDLLIDRNQAGGRVYGSRPKRMTPPFGQSSAALAAGGPATASATAPAVIQRYARGIAFSPVDAVAQGIGGGRRGVKHPFCETRVKV
jgi:hypothetical protein